MADQPLRLSGLSVFDMNKVTACITLMATEARLQRPKSGSDRPEEKTLSTSHFPRLVPKLKVNHNDTTKTLPNQHLFDIFACFVGNREVPTKMEVNHESSHVGKPPPNQWPMPLCLDALLGLEGLEGLKFRH